MTWGSLKVLWGCHDTSPKTEKFQDNRRLWDQHHTRVSLQKPFHLTYAWLRIWDSSRRRSSISNHQGRRASHHILHLCPSIHWNFLIQHRLSLTDLRKATYVHLGFGPHSWLWWPRIIVADTTGLANLCRIPMPAGKIISKILGGVIKVYLTLHGGTWSALLPGDFEFLNTGERTDLSPGKKGVFNSFRGICCKLIKEDKSLAFMKK